jgi:hypothetical protein
MPPLQEKWAQLADSDRELLPLFECFTSLAQALGAPTACMRVPFPRHSISASALCMALRMCCIHASCPAQGLLCRWAWHRTGFLCMPIACF